MRVVVVALAAFAFGIVLLSSFLNRARRDSEEMIFLLLVLVGGDEGGVRGAVSMEEKLSSLSGSTEAEAEALLLSLPLAAVK